MPASPENMPSSRRIRAASGVPTYRPAASSPSFPPQLGRRTPEPFRVAPPWNGVHAASSPFASPAPTVSCRRCYRPNVAPPFLSMSRWEEGC